MANGIVQVPPDSTGKIIDTSELTVGSNTVERQRINLADPTTAAAIAAILNADPSSSDYGLAVRPVATACSTYHVVAAASNNAASVKGSAGTLFGWRVFNNSGAPIFVKLYNKASSPSPASDTVRQVIAVQAGASSEESIGDLGIAYSTGIGIAIVAGISDTDNTAINASDCVVDIFYK